MEVPLGDKLKNGSFISAVFLMFMGTVGSGIFVLPYLFSQSNLAFASFFLVVLGIITIALNRFYAHIVISTPGDHQLAGYAAKYLGQRFGLLATLNLLLLSFGAITAYLKLFQSFVTLLFPAIPPFLLFVFYFLLLSTFYLLHFRPSNRLSFIVPIFMLLIPVFLFCFSFSFMGHTSYFINRVPNFSFFGATIYALSGFTIIPEVQEILLGDGRNRHSLHRAVTLGVILVIICYFLFVIGVIRLSNNGISIDSVTGISRSLPVLAKIIAIFGSVVVLRASFGFLLILRELFFRDLHFSSLVSNLLPLSFPLFSYALGSISLITIISLTGDITIFVSALLICLIRLRLSNTFWTQFWVISIMISLSLGLLTTL